MNDASLLKSNKIGTPKTPGGISKSLLTPCRRLGLSRNWKKCGPSPFISPLSGSGEVKHEKTETRKRKECILNEETPTIPIGEEDEDRVEDIDKTPSRHVDLPRKKKSKTLLSALTKNDKCTEITNNIETQSTSKDPIEWSKAYTNTQNENVSASEMISTPVHSKGIKTKKNVSPQKSISKEKVIKQCQMNDLEIKEYLTNNPKLKDTKAKEVIENREKSPQNLIKECIVVIQNKLFKKEIKEATENKVFIENITTNKEHNSVSQVLFDSDSDEVPLSSLHKKEIQNVMKPINSIDEDDDFANKTSKKKLDSNKLIPNVKINSKSKSKDKAIPKMVINTETSRTLLQNSIDDDDDDFDFENKKTILINKTYKIPKLLKAKSTGSITQKDIDELKARVEAKKKLLLAKAMTEDTKELRDLIKKWQKGCQDALMELMDLMKTKLPDKHNMDYSEILETLKIPASLVGYDSENDCFNTPDDANIILAQFNDL